MTTPSGAGTLLALAWEIYIIIHMIILNMYISPYIGAPSRFVPPALRLMVDHGPGKRHTGPGDNNTNTNIYILIKYYTPSFVHSFLTLFVCLECPRNEAVVRDVIAA